MSLPVHVQPPTYASPQSLVVEHWFADLDDGFAIVVVVTAAAIVVVITEGVVVTEAREELVVLKVVVVSSGRVEALADCDSSMSQTPFLLSSMQHSPPAQVLELVSNVEVVEIIEIDVEV